jgi:hypothetical protein
MDQVDLTENTRRAKELNRIAQRVQQIATRDFTGDIVVVIRAGRDLPPAVLIDTESDTVEES